MGVDKQGKNTVNKSTQRPSENKPSPVSQQVNKTKDKVDKALKK